MLVSASGSSAGADVITVTVPAGQSSGTFFAQALDSTGIVAAQANAPGYLQGQGNVTLAPSGFVISQPADFTTGAGSANVGLQVCANRLAGNVVQSQQQVRGGLTVNIAMTSSAPAVGTIVGTPFALTGGNTCTPLSGGLQFDPVTQGTSTVALVQPAGFTTPSTKQSIVATVGAPITVNANSPVGKDLQRSVSFTLGSPAPAGNLAVTLTSSDPTKLLLSTVNTAAGAASITVTVPAGQSSGTFFAQALVSTGTADVTATAPLYSDGVATVPFTPSGFRLLETDFSIGVTAANRPIQLCAAQLSAANLFQSNQQVRGGLTVNVGMTSSNPAVGAIVGSPFAFAGGISCQDTVAFDPLTSGTTTLTVVQPAGFATPTTAQAVVATVQANITANAVTVGKDLQTTASFNLGTPAPAGNLVVTITSSDPARLLVAPNATTAGAASATVTVAAGASSGNYVVQSLAATGSIPVTVSAPGYADGTANIDLTPSGFIISSPGSFSTSTLDPNTVLQLCSRRLVPGTLAASTQQNLRFGIAPVNLTVASASPTVGVIVNSPIAVAGNEACTTTGGGALAFDPVGVGTSLLTIGAPVGFSTPASSQAITATVSASGFALNALTVGKDLQSSASGSLQAPAPVGGIAVTLTSADPAKLLLAPNATTAGAASIVLNMTGGTTSLSYFVQALAGSGTVQVTASAPGLVNGSATVTLVPSGFIINSPTAINTTTLDPNSNMQVCASRLDPVTLNWATNQNLRFGIAPVNVSLTSGTPAVGTIVNTPQSIAGNASCTVSGAAGFQFDPSTAGSSVLAMGPTPAGFSTPSNFQSITATVTASGISMNAATVGKDLQTNASGSLQAPAPVGGVAVTLTSADPAKLLLAPNATTAGSASIVLNLAQNATSISYVVQALAGSGTVQVTATAPGFTSGAGTVTLVPSGFIINSPTAINTTTLDPNSNMQVCASRLDPVTLNWATNQNLRFGIAPVNVSLTSGTPAVGTIVNTPQSIAGNASCTVSGAAGFQFDPSTAGSSVLAMGPTPAGFSTPSNFQSITATVTASGISMNAATVGKDLQTNASGSLQAPAPVGGVAVTLTSADPAKLLLAPNATTAGSASIVLNLAQNATSISYVVQALAGSGTVQVTATAPGFTSGAGTVTLVPSGFIINSPTAINTTTLDPNSNMQVCASRLDPVTLNWATNQNLRFGIAPVNVSLTSGTPAVGTIVNTPQSIAGNASCTVSGAAGFQFDPSTAGSSVLAMGPTPAGFSTPSNFQSITATVTASGISMNAATVGKDLQTNASGSLQAPAPVGGVAVTLTSADPAKLLLAPNATTAGSASIVLNLAQNATSISYVVQALAGSGTVQVTASAPSFVDGTVNVALTPSGFVINSPSSISTTAAAANTNVQLCSAQLNATTFNRSTTQNLRFGIAPVSVGVTSSNPAVGVMVNSPGSIAGNASCTGGMQFDPLAVGNTTLTIGTPAGFSTPNNLQSISAIVN